MTVSHGIIGVVFWLAIFAGISPTRATSCTDAVAKCQIEGAGKERIVEKCRAAGATCKRTGVFVGPVTGRKWSVRR